MSSPSSTILALSATKKDHITIKSFGTHFVPKDLRSVTYGKEILIVYPKIITDMSLSGKAHVFNLKCAAIELSSLNALAKRQFVGSLHNTETIVNIV